ARRGAGAVERGGLHRGRTHGLPTCPLLRLPATLFRAAGCRSGRTGRSSPWANPWFPHVPPPSAPCDTVSRGGVPERSNGAVLKTVEPHGSVSSNLTPAAPL